MLFRSADPAGWIIADDNHEADERPLRRNGADVLDSVSGTVGVGKPIPKVEPHVAVVGMGRDSSGVGLAPRAHEADAAVELHLV